MKVLEALASGKAVVATSRGAEGYVELETPLLLVVADETVGIAAAIVALLADASVRDDLGRRGRAFAERHHSPTAWAKRLEDVYEEARASRLEPVQAGDRA